MKKMIEGIKHFFADEEGATAVEYGIMVSLIAVAIILAVSEFGTKLSQVFTGVEGKLVVPQ